MIDERWDAEVEEVADALARMLAAESSTEAVRRAEADHGGASPEIAAQIAAFGLDQLKGPGALFARVAMEFGRALAPTPFVETLPVLALTGRAGIAWSFDGWAPAAAEFVAVRTADGLFAEPVTGEPRLTAAGDRLIAHMSGVGGERLGDATLADRVERYAALTNAARIVGAGQALLLYAKGYVSQREQFGRPIGAFQAVGHRLADIVAKLDAADLMVRKAAFAGEAANGGDGAPPRHFAVMVWALAVEAGRLAATDGHQVFGGNGFAMEYDVQLYSRRIRSWAMRGPRVGSVLAELGRMVLDPAARNDMALVWHFERGIQLPRWAHEADAAAR